MEILSPYFECSNWKNVSEPIDISQQLDKGVLFLKLLLMELGLFFPDNKRGLSKKGSFLKFEQSFNIDMERMLVKKAHHVIKS